MVGSIVSATVAREVGGPSNKDGSSEIDEPLGGIEVIPFGCASTNTTMGG